MLKTKRRDFLKTTVGAAVAIGLVEIKEQLIEILGEKINNLRATWKPATKRGGKV